MNRDPRDNVVRWLGGLFVALLLLGGAVSWSNQAAQGYPDGGSAAASPAREPYVESWSSNKDSDIGSVYVEGIVANPTRKDWRFLQVKAPIYDRDGNLLGHAIDNIAGLPAGQSWRFRAIGLGMTGAQKAGKPELFGR